MKTLMILGALEEFVPLVELARKRNIRTVVVDGNQNAPAKKIADIAYDADIRNTRECADIARREHADAITTGYSDLLLECIVRIADEAGLPCHLKPAQLPYYRNKEVMHETCRQLGIPMTRSHLIRSEADLTEDSSLPEDPSPDRKDSSLGEERSPLGKKDSSLGEEGASLGEWAGLRFPMVLKPLDLYGSRGLTVVHNLQEMRDSLISSRSSSSIPEVLAEEYDPDDEFNMQCWVRHGEIHVLGIADREKTKFDVASIPLSTRNVYPSRSIPIVYKEAKACLAKYIRFTGQTEGPLCMQFFYGPERGLVVGEIAARFLGYEHELIRYSSGLSIEDLLLSAATDDARVDELLQSASPFGPRTAAVLYMHGRDGIIADMSSLIRASQRSDVVQSQIFYQEGDRIGSPQTMPYVARYDIVGDSREEIDARTNDILSGLSVRDSDGKELLLKAHPVVLPTIEHG